MGNEKYWQTWAKRTLLLVVGFGISAVLACWLAADICTAAQPVQAAAVVETDTVGFPYMIPGTKLVAERVASYEGPFLEDGSDREVVNIAALVLRNNGHSEISQAQVTLEQGSRELTFQVSHIPPGASVLVLEQDAKEYALSEYTACRGWAQSQSTASLTTQQLQTASVKLQTLSVTNLTDSTLENIVLYYKTWSEEMGLYLGGITYKMRVASLRPGEELQLQPYHFVNGYSKILKAIVQE